MNEVIGVLRALGYDEVQVEGGGWRPLSEVDGALGTTDDTHIIQEEEPPRVRLRDTESGKEIGRARKRPD